MTRISHFLLPALLVVVAACGDDGRPRTDSSVDTGTGDTSTGDTGTMDSGTMDTGTGDTSTGDTSTGDTGTGDTGTMDGGDAGDATTDAPMDAPMDVAPDVPMVGCVDMDLSMATGDAVASGDLTGAVDDGAGSCGSTLGEDRAYTWTAPSSAEWTFDTFGSDADTVLHIHTGAECTADELDCNDDVNFFVLQSRLDLTIMMGTTVTIVVDAYDDTSAGTFTLSITETSTIPASEAGSCTDGLDNDRDGDIDCFDPDCVSATSCFEIGASCSDTVDNDGDGDIDCADADCFGYGACLELICDDSMDDDGDSDVDCADSDCLTDAACETCPAVDLAMTLGTSTGTTTGETNNRAASCGGSTSVDRTHVFTAPAEGTYTIDTIGSTFDTVLYILDTDCDGAEIACDDDSGGSSTSEVVVDLGMGQSVIIVVDAFGGADGAYTLNIANVAMSFGAPTTAGDLVITEIMQNPRTPDAGNEWFEVVNTTTSSLNLNGCTVRDLGVNSFTIGSDLVVAPGEYAVLARTSTPGFTPRFDWPGSTALGNSDDEIIIECGAGPTEIDRVEWDGGPMFPDPNGGSMSLDDGTTDHVMNDTGSNWCEAPLYITPYDGTNRGTPGAPNPDCP